MNRIIAIIFIFTFLICLFCEQQSYSQVATILPPAETTFFDANGNPLSGGSVTFYIPNTTTFKTTWQDSAETIPNTNPVILDATGKALILGSGSYRQIVKDVNGNTIWDQVTTSYIPPGFASLVGDGQLVGTVKPWAAIVAPAQYAFAYGQTLSRTTYATLLTALTITTNIVCTSGSPIVTGVSDTTQIPVGAPIEVTCVSGGTTVLSKTASTITLSANATITANASAIFFPYGDGDGSTTFTLPDLRGYVIAGRDNMGGSSAGRLTTTYFGNNTPDAIGATGGNQANALSQGNLPNLNLTTSIASGQGSHTHTISSLGTNNNFATTAASTAYIATGTTTTNTATLPSMTGTTATGGSATPFTTIQPTITLNYIIKVLPDLNQSIANGVDSIQGMTGVLTCGSGLTCTGNVLNSAISFPISGGSIATNTITNSNILANTITNASLAQMAADTFKCNNAGVTANVSDCATSGLDQNVLNSQITGYTITLSDCGKTIQAGTGSTGFFTITLPSVSGFPGTCVVSIKNGDTTRGKLLSGFPSDLTNILWPSQFLQVRIINGAWATSIPFGRWYPVSGAPTLNVDHANGSDTNNDCLGTGAGACATFTHAIALLTSRIDCGAGEPIIQNAAETFTENVIVLGPPCGAGHSNIVHFIGNSGTPASVVWQPSGANGIGLTCFDLAMCLVNGFTCQSSASGQTCFQASKLGYVGVGNIVFGLVTSGYHMQCSLGGTINYETGTYTVSGNMINHLFGTQNCNAQWLSIAISIPNALTFTDWVVLSQGASLNTTATFSGTGAGAGSTGTKYAISLNATAILNGTTLPGASAGGTSTGGQVSP